MKKNTKGYIAISSILVIAAIVFIIGTSVSLVSVNDIQSALAGKKGQQALNLVEGCVEDALLRLSNTNAIPSTISLPEGTCSVTINIHSGNDWTFTTTGTFENYTKSVKVSANRGSSLTVTSWVEM